MSTPRSKPISTKDGASAAKPAAKPKAKKPKGSAAPSVPLEAPTPQVSAELSEADAKRELDSLQQKYGVLVVNFNNQQAELKDCQSQLARAESELEMRRAKESGSADEGSTDSLVEKLKAELKSMESANMTLQKKVNKLQVEHVSEEEVDQLFFALEQKEQQLEITRAEKEQLEGEVLTARQMSARGGGVPTVVEIHHHNNLSDDDDDDDDDAGNAAKADEPKEVS